MCFLQTADSVNDVKDEAIEFMSKARADPEGERHFLLASVYDMLLKRETKQAATGVKNLLSLHRHIDLAERRMKERKKALTAICNGCRQEMLALQDSHCLSVLEWQRNNLISKFEENIRSAN